MIKNLLKKIALFKLELIAKGIDDKYKLQLRYSDQVSIINYITNKVHINKGGRDILNAINDYLLDPLANFLFENRDELRSYRGSWILISLKDNTLNFDWDFDN